MSKVTLQNMLKPVTRKTLSELVNERAGISPEMAVRLAKAFGGTPRAWLDTQTAYDLSRIDPAQIKVKLYAPETRFPKTL